MLNRRVTDTNTWAQNGAICQPRFPEKSSLVLQVRPLGVGWCVLGLGEPTFFLSGSRAEQAARTLALAAARQGGPVELRISDRGGQLAGRFLFGTPNGEAPPPPAPLHPLSTSALNPAAAHV